MPPTEKSMQLHLDKEMARIAFLTGKYVAAIEMIRAGYAAVDVANAAAKDLEKYNIFVERLKP